MRKSRTWGGHIEIIEFAELFETNIFIYDLVTDLEPRHKWNTLIHKIQYCLCIEIITSIIY